MAGGERPPERDGPSVKNIYGMIQTGWKLRGVPLTKVFMALSADGWTMCGCNGSGAGTNSFAEMVCGHRVLVGGSIVVQTDVAPRTPTLTSNHSPLAVCIFAAVRRRR